MEYIEIIGAKTHNLKNINLKIPKYSFSVVTGVSGSGKSSLVFNTIYGEAFRRFLESIGTYERQFINNIEQGEFDEIKNLPPTIAIKQENKTTSSHATIATSLDIHIPLTNIFTSCMDNICITCGSIIETYNINYLYDYLTNINKEQFIYLTISLHELFANSKINEQNIKLILGMGYNEYIQKNDNIISEENININITDFNNKFIVLDRLVMQDNIDFKIRLEQAWNSAKYIKDISKIYVINVEKNKIINMQEFLVKNFCFNCNKSVNIIKFSDLDWNSALGWCQTCQGLGTITKLNENKTISEKNKNLLYKENKTWSEKKISRFIMSKYQSYQICPDCLGKKLTLHGQKAIANNKKFYELMNLELNEVLLWLNEIKNDNKYKNKITALEKQIVEVENKINKVITFGLDFLFLWRSTKTLSGGEYQRLILAKILGNGLSNSLYIFDEPSTGLGKLEIEGIIKAFKELTLKQNTVLIVEHDVNIIKQADYFFELGYDGGENGGYLIENKYPLPLSAQANLQILEKYTTHHTQQNIFKLENFSALFCQNLNIELLEGKLNLITGPSGSGKSTLLNFGIAAAAEKLFCDNKNFNDNLDLENKIGTWTNFNAPHYKFEYISLKQHSFSRSSLSTVATILGVMDLIRTFFAASKEAQMNKLSISYFSFNSKGACEHCLGKGKITDNLFFLGEFKRICPDCNGLKFNQQTLKINIKNKNIAQILNMTINEALIFWEGSKKITDILFLAQKIGIGYLNLNIETSDLSGGELQRLKIASALSHTKKKLFAVLDEPTRGLSEQDIIKLLDTFLWLTEQGHTFIVAEHHDLFCQYAHKIIKLGPASGKYGSKIIE